MFRSPIDRMVEVPVRSRIPRSLQKDEFCEKHSRYFRGFCLECMTEQQATQEMEVLLEVITGTGPRRPVWPEGAEL